MKKIVLWMIVFCFMFLIQGCKVNEDDFLIMAGSSPTAEEQLEVQPYQGEGYWFAAKFHVDSTGMNIQTLYIWDQQLRMDIHNLLIDMMNQIIDFSVSVLQFDIEINQSIIISVNGTNVIESEISLEALLVASMFPSNLSFSRTQFIMFMAPVVASIEAGIATGSSEIIWVKTSTDQSLLIQEATMTPNEIHAFKNLNEYLIFLEIGQ